jgi:hypothetical protein
LCVNQPSFKLRRVDLGTPMRVLLIKARSHYNALRRFTDEVDRALSARGIETVVADVAETSDAEDLALLSSVGPVDFGFTFFVFGNYVDAESKRSIGEIIGGPMVVQYVDYPLTSCDALAGTASRSAILTVDPSHSDAVHQLFGAQRFAYVGFNPHAAVGEPHPPQSSPAAFAAERPISILFSGSWYAPGVRPWKDMPEYIRKLFNDAADLVLSQEFIPALDAVDTVLRAAGGDPADPQFLVVRMYAFLIHEWVRAMRRHAFFQAAAKVGLPLTICGDGYAQAGIDLNAFDHRDGVDFDTTIALMRQSKVVANVNANFGRGSHERPFTAMLAGAVAASDFSTYYADAFAPGQEIVLYRWTHIEEDLAALRDLLEDPVRLHAIAEAGHANACKNHRWDNRIDAILAAADVCRRA